jgi:hypothetical protein
MQVIDVSDEEHVAVTATVRRSIAVDKFPAIAGPGTAEIGLGQARPCIGPDAATGATTATRGTHA